MLSVFSLSTLVSAYLPIYPCMFLSVCLLIHLSVLIRVCLCVCLPTSHLSVYLSICLFVYLSTYLPTYLSIYLFIYLSIYLSVYIYLSITSFCPFCQPLAFLSKLAFYVAAYLSICLSIYLSVYLSSICLSIYPSILSSSSARLPFDLFYLLKSAPHLANSTAPLRPSRNLCLALRKFCACHEICAWPSESLRLVPSKSVLKGSLK